MNLKWDDMRVFLAVARAGTLAKAGEALGINASTVHRRINALEAALSVRLFERDPRGYTPTSVGEALIPQAEEVEEAVLALRRTATGHDHTASGPVVLTLPQTLVGLLTPYIAEVRQTCPGLHPILRVDERPLALGVETDIALRVSANPQPSAVGRKLGAVRWAAYASAEGAPWITYTEDAGPSAAIAWRRRHFPDPPTLFEVSSVGAMLDALRGVSATGLLPVYLGDAEPSLKRATGIIEEATTDLWLLIHADLRRSARVRAFIDALAPGLEQIKETLSRGATL